MAEPVSNPDLEAQVAAALAVDSGLRFFWLILLVEGNLVMY